MNVVRSYGSNEAKVPDIVDAIVHNIETGDTFARNGLRDRRRLDGVVDRARRQRKTMEDEAKRRAIEELHILLDGAVRARGRVLVKLNVPKEKLDAVLRGPALDEGADGFRARRRRRFAVETVVPKADDQHAHPGAEGAGREDIIELPLSKIVP